MFGAGMHDAQVHARGDAQQLQERLSKLESDKGDVDGLVHILQGKLGEATEENFELRANMATIEAEIQFESRKKEEEMGKQVALLESRLSFLTEQLKNADRVKLRAMRELDELRQKQLLEQKRIDAEKRLLATKKRKHDSVLFAASQTKMAHMSQRELSKPAPSTSTSAPSTASTTTTSAAAASVSQEDASTDMSVARSKVSSHSGELSETERLVRTNCALLSMLMDKASRELLLLFKGSNQIVSAIGTPTKGGEPAVDSLESSALTGNRQMSEEQRASQFQHDSAGSLGFTQSVFSQIAGQAQAQANASLMTFAKEVNLTQTAYANERAKDLHDILAKMIRGEATATALAPVLIRYLAAPTDLDVELLCGVMRLLYFVMTHSACFQELLLVSSSSGSTSSSSSATAASITTSNAMEHPRISLSGLRFTSLDEYLSSRKEEYSSSHRPHSSSSSLSAASSPAVTQDQHSDQMQVRAKLLSALCRVIKNNLNQASVVDCGLAVLALWVDLGVTSRSVRTDFRALITGSVLQDVVLAPKSMGVALKTRALGILANVLHVPDVFPEIDASSRRTLLFNRCAKMLSIRVGASDLERMRPLQSMIIHVFTAIIVSHPSRGVRFVLESTREKPSDLENDHSIVFYLAQLLHHETFDARTLGYDARERLLASSPRVTLVRDAFTLLAMLVRYVDLNVELHGVEHVHSFHSVLYLLRSTAFDRAKNDAISKTAAALLTVMAPPKPL